MKTGPKINIKEDKRVKALRDKGLSFREIAKIVGSDVALVYRRYKRALTYPQGGC